MRVSTQKSSAVKRSPRAGDVPPSKARCASTAGIAELDARQRHLLPVAQPGNRLNSVSNIHHGPNRPRMGMGNNIEDIASVRERQVQKAMVP
jgi:hypothetical protein